ncbi:MAG: hypothetical protein ACLQU5_20860 [Isosphaeraceae bacterium]
MSINLNLDDAALRKKVEEILAQTPSTQVASIGSIIAQEIQNSQRTSSGYGYTAISSGSPQLSFRELGRIHDIIWDLIIDGHVRPGLGDGQNNNVPFLHVTAKGTKYFQSSTGGKQP